MSFIEIRSYSFIEQYGKVHRHREANPTITVQINAKIIKVCELFNHSKRSNSFKSKSGCSFAACRDYQKVHQGMSPILLLRHPSR